MVTVTCPVCSFEQENAHNVSTQNVQTSAAMTRERAGICASFWCTAFIPLPSPAISSAMTRLRASLARCDRPLGKEQVLLRNLKRIEPLHVVRLCGGQLRLRVEQQRQRGDTRFVLCIRDVEHDARL